MVTKRRNQPIKSLEQIISQPMSLRENRNRIVISKIIIRKTTINKTVIDKIVIKIQETQETRRQGSKVMLRVKTRVKETKKLKQEDASHVEYAQKPHMVICLGAQSFRSTFQANQEDQLAHPRRFA